MRHILLILCALSASSAMAQEETGTATLTVDRLFELVEAHSPALVVAKGNVEAAEHGIAAAKSERLPELNASLAFSYYGNVIQTDRDFSNAIGFSSPHFGNSFTFNAEQVVYAGGALTAGIRLAEIGREQAETGVLATRQGQRFLAVAQYLELLQADNALQVYDHNIALTQRLIADIEAKHAEGMALKNDITRYELQMETLRLGRRKVEDHRSVLNHQICNTLGLEAGTVIRPDTTLMLLSERERETDWQARATAASTDLRFANLNTLAAQQQVKLAKSELLPHLALFAWDDFTGPYNYDLPPIDKNYNVWSVGVGLSYSLSSLFKQNKTVRQRRAQLLVSQEAEAEAAEAVDNRMNEAHTLYLQAFEELRTRRKSAQLARENYQVVNDRYLNDLALITDMTDASNILLSAELDETNARIQIVYAYYKMMYIAGEI